MRRRSRSLKSESMNTPSERSSRRIWSCSSRESGPYAWPIASVVESEIASRSVRAGESPRPSSFQSVERELQGDLVHPWICSRRLRRGERVSGHEVREHVVLAAVFSGHAVRFRDIRSPGAAASTPCPACCSPSLRALNRWTHDGKRVAIVAAGAERPVGGGPPVHIALAATDRQDCAAVFSRDGEKTRSGVRRLEPVSQRRAPKPDRCRGRVGARTSLR